MWVRINVPSRPTSQSMAGSFGQETNGYDCGRARSLVWAFVEREVALYGKRSREEVREGREVRRAAPNRAARGRVLGPVRRDPPPLSN